jgi:hypothetical protein
MANLDPLHISNADLDSKVPPELTLDYYGWTEADLKQEFQLSAGILPRFVGTVPGDKMTLGQIINELKTMYCELLISLSELPRLIAQAITLVSSTSISLIEGNATGSENALRSLNNGNTRRRRRR